MVLCYEEKGKNVNNSKRISKLKVCKWRAIVLMDSFIKFLAIASDYRKYGETEYIRYDTIRKIVDVEGAGIAVYGDVYNAAHNCLLTGDDGFRYIPASITNYDVIVRTLLEITGLSLEYNVNKLQAEVLAVKKGKPMIEKNYLTERFVSYASGEILVAELAKLCPPMGGLSVKNFSERLDVRIARSTHGLTKTDISGEEFVLVCGPRNYKMILDGRGTVPPWKSAKSQYNDVDLYNGTIYEYRIPFKNLEKIRMEYSDLNNRMRWVWNRLCGSFQVTEYATVTDWIMGHGVPCTKEVDEILFRTPFFRYEGNRTHLSEGGDEWHGRIAQMSEKTWEESI